MMLAVLKEKAEQAGVEVEFETALPHVAQLPDVQCLVRWSQAGPDRSGNNLPIVWTEINHNSMHKKGQP